MLHQFAYQRQTIKLNVFSWENVPTDQPKMTHTVKKKKKKPEQHATAKNERRVTTYDLVFLWSATGSCPYL